MKIWGHFFTLGSILLLLQGCNTAPINYTERLHSTTSCCLQPSALPTEKLKFADKPQSFHLGDKHQKIIEDQGQRVFALKLELPVFTSPYSINIKSIARHDLAFVPKLRLLSEDGKVSRTFKNRDFIFNISEYEITLFINESQSHERYILISEDIGARSQVQKMMGVEVNTITTGNGVAFNYGSGDIKKTILSARGGEIEVSLIEYKPITLKDLREKNQ